MDCSKFEIFVATARTSSAALSRSLNREISKLLRLFSEDFVSLSFDGLLLVKLIQSMNPKTDAAINQKNVRKI